MSSIPQTVRAGEDVMINRYYSVAMAVLFVYDYFLTLPDEIRYVWKGGKTWMFYVFLINRYAPFISQTWTLVVQSVISAETFFIRSLCRESTIIKALSFVISTLIAQVVVGARAYALSGFNRKLLAVLLLIGVVYLVFAVALIHTIIMTVGAPPKEPFEALRMCLENPGQFLGFSCMAAVLAFDTVAITSIVVYIVRVRRKTLGLSKIPRIMFRDVTVYFLVIFISHLSLVISVNAARPELKILPAIGLEVMIPMMITRFTLALKKAVGKGSIRDEDIFTNQLSTVRALTPHDNYDDTVLRFAEPETSRAREGLPSRS